VGSYSNRVSDLIRRGRDSEKAAPGKEASPESKLAHILVLGLSASWGVRDKKPPSLYFVVAA
jgi:hypothetical protein